MFFCAFLVVRGFFYFLAPCLTLQFYLTPNIVNLLGLDLIGSATYWHPVYVSMLIQMAVRRTLSLLRRKLLL